MSRDRQLDILFTAERLPLDGSNLRDFAFPMVWTGEYQPMIVSIRRASTLRTDYDWSPITEESARSCFCTVACSICLRTLIENRAPHCRGFYAPGNALNICSLCLHSSSERVQIRHRVIELAVWLKEELLDPNQSEDMTPPKLLRMRALRHPITESRRLEDVLDKLERTRTPVSEPSISTESGSYC